MKIEDYYARHYPEGKAWEQLTREEQRDIRKARRKESWENVKDTVVDIRDFIDVLLMVFSLRK